MSAVQQSLYLSISLRALHAQLLFWQACNTRINASLFVFFSCYCACIAPDVGIKWKAAQS